MQRNNFIEWVNFIGTLRGKKKKELGQKCDRISQKYLILANVPFTKIEQMYPLQK